MCLVCERVEGELAAANVTRPSGAIAQLVERFHGMEEAGGSIPPSSTSSGLSATAAAAGYSLAGLVAGEGCFTVEPAPAARSTGRRVCGSGSCSRWPCVIVAGRRPRSGISSASGRSRTCPPVTSAWQPTVNYSVSRPQERPRSGHPLLRHLPGRRSQAARSTCAGAPRFTRVRSALPLELGCRAISLRHRRLRQDRCEDGGCAVPTTTRRPATDVANFIGGFVAAEGCFQVRPGASTSFSFVVALGRDGPRRWSSCCATFFGCGRIDVARATPAALRRRGHVRRAAAARSRGGDRAVHGRAPSAFLQARPVRGLAGRAARLLGARRSPSSAVHRRRLHRAPAGEGPVPAPLLRGVRRADRCRRTTGWR